jgi:predicted deacetylase
MPPTKPFLCVAVHDVAPVTWALTSRILKMLDALGAKPLTLLVVPNYHERGLITDDPAFVQAIESRKASGDEVALHGYTHLDEGSAPRGLVDYLARRVLTRSEGEFAALSAPEACRRIEQALAVWRELGWAIEGFVPPAWLLSEGSGFALAQYGFTYATTHRGLWRLPDWRLTPARVLSYSPQNTWRRLMSRAVIRAHLGTVGEAPLRIALHPVDALREDVLAHWRQVLEGLIETRQVVTKSAWALAAERADTFYASAR